MNEAVDIYANQNLESKMAETIEAALKAGRDDIVLLLAPVVSLPALITVIKNRENDAIRESLIGLLPRQVYDREDVDRIVNYTLYQSAHSYRDTLHTIVEGAVGQNTKLRFFKKALTSGLHELAIHTLNVINNDAVARQDVLTFINDITPSINCPNAALRLLLGSTKLWNQATIDILNRLDLDAPGIDMGVGKNRDDEWLKDRFDAQINAVGNRLQEMAVLAPRVGVKGGRLIVEEGSELINSLIIHHDRLSTLGTEVKEFPAYVPCMFTLSQKDALMEMGGHPIEPRLVKTCNQGVEVPHHGYETTLGTLPPWEVAVATAMLPDMATAELMRREETLMLMPYQAFEPGVKIDPQLHKAVRYFRPEPIMQSLEPELIHPFKRFRSTEVIPLDMYLKGVPLQTQGIGFYDFSAGIKTVSDLEFMVSEAEKEYLFQCFAAPAKPYEILKSLSFVQNGSVADEVARLEDCLSKLEDYFSIQPRINITGNRDFLETISQKQLGMRLNILDMYASIDQYDQKEVVRLANSNYVMNEHRLAVRIGAHLDQINTKFGTTPSELLAKGVRCRDADDIQSILGALDRYPLVDVVNSASTLKQLEFASDHFDVKSVFKQTNLKTQKMLARLMLDKGFSLGGPSL